MTRSTKAPVPGFMLIVLGVPFILAVLALTNGSGDVPIICNGFKDDEFIKMVVLAKKIGKNIIPVVEKFSGPECQGMEANLQKSKARLRQLRSAPVAVDLRAESSKVATQSSSRRPPR